MFSPVRDALAAQSRVAARANFASANNPTAQRIASLWTDNVIGDGPTARSQHPNRIMRRALESAWARFYRRAGLDGDLCAVLRLAFRAMVIDGEVLLLMQTTARGEVRVRVLSSRHLDASVNREAADGGQIVSGVEFDLTGERVAYWILPDADPLATISRAAVRVPAEDVIHLFDPKFPGQVRGLSWLTAVLPMLMEFDRLLDALSARMNTAALFGAWITDPEGSAFGDAVSKTSDRAELSMEPGIVRILPPGADIRFPDLPTIDGAPDLLRQMLRSIAAGCDLPYELLAGDLSHVNFRARRRVSARFIGAAKRSAR
jgi:lambda family phage portal protein